MTNNSLSKIIINANSRYPIRRKKIKDLILRTLESLQIFEPVYVEVDIIGDRKMRELKNKYLGIDETTDVLSFPLQESVINGRVGDNFVEFPDHLLHLGNIFVSYPQAQRQANLHKLGIDDEINQLVEHSIFHLVGIHHE